MRDIRNLAGRLVCRLDEDIGVVETRRKGCPGRGRRLPRWAPREGGAKAPGEDMAPNQHRIAHRPTH
jgi:hypothetical protein